MKKTENGTTFFLLEEKSETEDRQEILRIFKEGLSKKIPDWRKWTQSAVCKEIGMFEWQFSNIMNCKPMAPTRIVIILKKIGINGFLAKKILIKKK